MNGDIDKGVRWVEGRVWEDVWRFRVWVEGSWPFFGSMC
jgi:hypothetical protein